MRNFLLATFLNATSSETRVSKRIYPDPVSEVIPRNGIIPGGLFLARDGQITNPNLR